MKPLLTPKAKFQLQELKKFIESSKLIHSKEETIKILQEGITPSEGVKITIKSTPTSINVCFSAKHFNVRMLEMEEIKTNKYFSW